MILGINGNHVWCRATEEKILQAWEELALGKCKRISVRDSLVFKENGIIDYILWNTTLVKADKDRKNVYIYIASNMEEIDRYYKPNPYNTWRPKDYIISNTTKSRLNAFLSYYDMDLLEVHSSKKEWSVKYRGKELALDCWYKLDLKTKELVKE
jgi:hypothetical protein